MSPQNSKTSPIIIECPKCGESYEITEALRESIAEKTRGELEGEMKKREQEISAKEEKIEGDQKKIEKLQAEIDKKINDGVSQQVSQEKAKILANAKKEIEDKFSLELKDKDEQIKEKDKALESARNAELSARKKEREAEEKIKNADIEVEKKLAKEKADMEVEISKRYSDDYSLKERESQKKISDLVKQLDEAKIRAEQGSQQMQGEVQELDLEEALKNAFPQDIIEPVEKGVKGADVRHKVRSNSGKIVGVILWESKRTKNWSDGWLHKLKDDLRAEAANIPVILSSALPDEANSGLGQKDGVWICKPSMAISLAVCFRRQLIDVAIANAQSESRGTLADSLYDYVTSHEFRQQIESMVEVYKEMKNQITKERIAYERSWKTREAQVDRMFTDTARIVGSIQGRLGDTAFGPVKGLDLLESGEGEEESF